MVDVVIFCEGTYPYISGGVSSWIHALVTAMPSLTFGLVFLAPSRSWKREFRYQLPPNVKEFVEVSIYDVRLCGSPGVDWKLMEEFSSGLVEGHWPSWERLFRGLKAWSVEEMAYSPQAWDILVRQYRQKAPSLSFVDWFWTWRFVHFPLFQLLNASIPQAHVYHTVTTGWSGLLGTLASLRTGRPLVLTEHGIYTNERRIEIVKADWIYMESLAGNNPFGVLKSLWMNLFQALGRLCYDASCEIYTLYGGNLEKQVAAGALRSKIEVVPNGVRLWEGEHEPGEHFRIGFVGRVVPIKDVLTLIRAMRIVVDASPSAVCYVIGPTDEDPGYFSECQSLVATLGLEASVIFTGPQNVKEWYPSLDALVLTSISEGQPLVILEAFVVGVPCVATDVGACSEIILGAGDGLGPAGFVTSVGAFAETASALLSLEKSSSLRASMREAGRARVRKYYDHEDMIARYQGIYERLKAHGGDRISTPAPR